VAGIAAAEYIARLQLIDRPGEVDMSSLVQSLGRRRRALAAGGVAVLAAAGAVVALATASAGAAVTHRAAAAVSNPSCATAQLAVKFVNKPNGAAGTIFYPIRFTNKGTHACTLRGYPGVSAVTSAGAQIGNPAGRSGNPVKTVTLAPKKSASTMVGFAHTANFPAAKCKPVTARGLRVIPPNQSTSVTIKRKFSACSGKAVTYLTVLPVK
jgi:Protein of unknown function (DUF4232)